MQVTTLQIAADRSPRKARQTDDQAK